jgi:hypothetical protein
VAGVILVATVILVGVMILMCLMILRCLMIRMLSVNSLILMTFGRMGARLVMLHVFTCMLAAVLVAVS